MEKARIDYLLERQMARLLTEAEQQELRALLSGDYSDVLVQSVMEGMMKDANYPMHLDEASRKAGFARVMGRDGVHSSSTDNPRVHRVPFFQMGWFRYAAMLLLIAGAVTFFVLSNHQPKPSTMVQNPVLTPSDILPGGQKATLTLDNGQELSLEDLPVGALADQGNSTITKLRDGILSYEHGVKGADLIFNQIRTPRGGQYRVVLSDGTTVWLNAASSIRFPVAFSGQSRRVEVSGEVYFEIHPDAGRPFFVNVGESEIQVLGTAFNVNAYPDVSGIYTTLINGSIVVKSTGYLQTLQPGQQSKFFNGTLTLQKDPNIEKVTAWRSGLFNFDHASLKEVMGQLSRWYDIDVEFEPGVSNIEFGGKMSHNVPLSDVLAGLKDSGVRFRMDKGRKLIVIP